MSEQLLTQLTIAFQKSSLHAHMDNMISLDEAQYNDIYKRSLGIDDCVNGVYDSLYEFVAEVKRLFQYDFGTVREAGPNGPARLAKAKTALTEIEDFGKQLDVHVKRQLKPHIPEVLSRHEEAKLYVAQFAVIKKAVNFDTLKYDNADRQDMRELDGLFQTALSKLNTTLQRLKRWPELSHLDML
jgi:hypothetical protein